MSGYRLLVIFSVAVSFALRFLVFSTEELGLDGHLSVGLASVPLEQMLAFNLRDVHPPLIYIALGAWLGGVGTNFIAAKWFSIAAGVLTIPLIYQLARRLMGQLAGLMAAVLLVASPAHIFLSSTVRDFAPGLFLSVLSLLALHALVGADAQQRPRRLLLLGLCLALVTGGALLTWYFHGLYLALQVGYLAVRRPRQWRVAGLALAGGVLIAMPWLTLALPPLLAKASGGVTVSGATPRLLDPVLFAREAVNGLIGAELVPWPALAVYWILLSILGLIAASRRGRDKIAALGSFAVLVAGLITAYLLAGLWVHSTSLARYLLIPLPFSILTQAAITTAFSRRVSITCLVALLVPAAAWYGRMATAAPIPYKEDPVWLYLEPRFAEGDAVIFTDIARLGFHRLRNPHPVPSYAVHFAGSTFLEDDVAARTRDLLPAILRRHNRIWLVDSAPEKRNLALIIEQALGVPLGERMVLRSPFTQAEVLSFRGTRKDGYRPPAGEREGVVFGEEIRLEGYEVRGDRAELAPGDVITVDLLWSAVARVKGDYVVTLQVLDSEGRLAAQSDGPPAGGRAPTSTWRVAEPLVDSRTVRMPERSGSYTLGVALYEWPSLRRLAIAGRPDNLLPLQSVTVSR